MTPKRKKRLITTLLIVLGVSAATAIMTAAFRENILYFKSPSDIAEGNFPQQRNFRVGGMVKEGTFQQAEDSLKVSFVVTDYAKEVSVHYEGILPDLFREGQGVVAIGRMQPDGTFAAEEVLAKHDEKYMPPEVAATLKEKPGSGDTPATSASYEKNQE